MGLSKDTLNSKYEKGRIDVHFRKATAMEFLDAVDYSTLHNKLLTSYKPFTNSVVAFVESRCQQLMLEVDNVAKRVFEDRQKAFRIRTDETRFHLEQKKILASRLFTRANVCFSE